MSPASSSTTVTVAIVSAVLALVESAPLPAKTKSLGASFTSLMLTVKPWVDVEPSVEVAVTSMLCEVAVS